MNNYVTGSTIKTLRESKKLTQAQLANMISVSDKAVSRWETGKGFPDVSLLESLSKALGISVIELISGDRITNRNVSSNMQRSKFYVCPICGNVIHSMGEALISCCGITLPCLEAEETDNDHYMNVEYIEDTSVDNQKAAEYFEKSAEQGNEYAQNILDNQEKFENEMLASTIFSLFINLSRCIEDNYHNKFKSGRKIIDSKLRRMISQKKQSLGIKNEPSQSQEQSY